jgi:hypothetical protein
VALRHGMLRVEGSQMGDDDELKELQKRVLLAQEQDILRRKKILDRLFGCLIFFGVFFGILYLVSIFFGGWLSDPSRFR